MKPIKFDLPLNGTRVHNLEELRDNFTTEILENHASGLLLKWLKSRNLMTEADKLSAISANHSPVDNMVALCDIFGIEADRQVIEAALFKSQPSQGVALRQDPDELKYKEKFEKLSELMEGLKSKKLYLTQDDYNLFVKNKIQIEQEGKIESVVFCEETYKHISWPFSDIAYDSYYHFNFNPLMKLGDVVEVGDIIGEINTDSHGPWGGVKSPLRGVLVEMGEITQKTSSYRSGDPICYIQIDHDTAPTIKIIVE